MHSDYTLPYEVQPSARSRHVPNFTESEGDSLISDREKDKLFKSNATSPLISKESSLPRPLERMSIYFKARQSDSSVEDTERELEGLIDGLVRISENSVQSADAIAKGVKEDMNNRSNNLYNIKPWQRLKNDLPPIPRKKSIDNNNNQANSSPSVFSEKDGTKPKQVKCTCSTTTSVVKAKNLENQDLCIACTFSQEVDHPVDPKAKLNKNPNHGNSTTADIKMGDEDLDSLTDWLDTLDISQKPISRVPLKSEEVENLSDLLRDVKLEPTASPAKEQDKRTSNCSKNKIRKSSIKHEKLHLASAIVSETVRPSIIKLESRSHPTLDKGSYFSFGGEATNEKEKDDALLRSYPKYTQPSYQYSLAPQTSAYINKIQKPDRHHFSIKQPSFQTPHLQNAFNTKQLQSHGKSHHQFNSYMDTSSHYQSPFDLAKPFNMQPRSDNNRLSYQPYLSSNSIISEIPFLPLSSYAYSIRQDEPDTACSSSNEDLGNVNKSSEEIINVCHQTPATNTSKQPCHSSKQPLPSQVYDNKHIDTNLHYLHNRKNNLNTNSQRDNAKDSKDDLPILLDVLSQQSLTYQQTYDSTDQNNSSSAYNPSSSYSDYSKANEYNFIHADSSLDNSSSNSNTSGQSPVNALEDEIIPNYLTLTYNEFDILQLVNNSGFFDYSGLIPIDDEPQKLEHADLGSLEFMTYPDKIATNDDILHDLYTTMVLPEHTENLETGSNNKLQKSGNLDPDTEDRSENDETQHETVNVAQKEHNLNTNEELEHLLNFDPISMNTSLLGPDALRKELELENYISFPSNEINPDFDRSPSSHIQQYNFVEFNPSKIIAVDSSKTREGRVTKSNRTECLLCKKSMLKKNLSSHLKIHDKKRKKDNVCGICGSSYFYLKDLTRHTRLEHR